MQNHKSTRAQKKKIINWSQDAQLSYKFHESDTDCMTTIV